jgi:hypothetical protein
MLPSLEFEQLVRKTPGGVLVSSEGGSRTIRDAAGLVGVFAAHPLSVLTVA